jgi:hypothetical protein
VQSPDFKSQSHQKREVTIANTYALNIGALILNIETQVKFNTIIVGDLNTTL